MPVFFFFLENGRLPGAIRNLFYTREGDGLLNSNASGLGALYTCYLRLDMVPLSLPQVAKIGQEHSVLRLIGRGPIATGKMTKLSGRWTQYKQPLKGIMDWAGKATGPQSWTGAQASKLLSWSSTVNCYIFNAILFSLGPDDRVSIKFQDQNWLCSIIFKYINSLSIPTYLPLRCLYNFTVTPPCTAQIKNDLTVSY